MQLSEMLILCPSYLLNESHSLGLNSVVLLTGHQITHLVANALYSFFFFNSLLKHVMFPLFYCENNICYC